MAASSLLTAALSQARIHDMCSLVQWPLQPRVEPCTATTRAELGTQGQISTVNPTQVHCPLAFHPLFIMATADNTVAHWDTYLAAGTCALGECALGDLLGHDKPPGMLVLPRNIGACPAATGTTDKGS
jgi:hypothetical protein